MKMENFPVIFFGVACSSMPMNIHIEGVQSQEYEVDQATAVVESDKSLGETYYVAPDGDDANPGALDAPWQSVNHGIAQLQPGDTLYLKEGIYYETLNIAVQGTDTEPITIKNYPGENPIIDGGYQEFRTPSNTDWEVVDAAKDIYRSVKQYPTGGVMHAYLVFDDKYYHLVPYERYSDLRSNNQRYKLRSDSPNHMYVGPGLFWNKSDEKIYIRLAPSQQELAMGYNIPAKPDPGQNEIHIVPPGTAVMFEPTAAHLVFAGIGVRFRNNAYRFQTGSHHINITDSTVLGGRTHIMMEEEVHHLLLDAVTIDDSVPPWVTWSDVKQETKPAHSLQQAGIDMKRLVHDVEIKNLTFNNIFDAIDATDLIYNVRIHHNKFYGIRDDVLQLGTASYNVEVDHNQMIHVSKGPSRQGSGLSTQPGTKYIHHNVIDLTKRWLHFRVGHPKYEPSDDGMIWNTAFGSHNIGSNSNFGDPWKIYNNTIVMAAATNGNLVPMGIGYDYTLSTIEGIPQEVYNNIFVQTMAHRIARSARIHDGSQIMDGNLYYRVVPAASPEYLFRQWENATTTASFDTLADFRSHPFFAETQSYYPPGWENSGVEANPLLSETYDPYPGGPAAQGAIDLSSKGWPGADGLPYRGAARAVDQENQPQQLALAEPANQPQQITVIDPANQPQQIIVKVKFEPQQ